VFGDMFEKVFGAAETQETKPEANNQEEKKAVEGPKPEKPEDSKASPPVLPTSDSGEKPAQPCAPLQAFPKTEKPVTAEPIMGLTQVEIRDEKKKPC